MEEELLERTWQGDNPEAVWVWQAEDSMDIWFWGSKMVMVAATVGNLGV